MLRKSGDTKKPQGDCLDVMSFIYVAERSMFITGIAFPGKLGQGKGRVGHDWVGQERKHDSLDSR